MNKLILFFCLFAFSTSFAQNNSPSADHGVKFRKPPPPPPPPRSKEEALRWQEKQKARRQAALKIDNQANTTNHKKKPKANPAQAEAKQKLNGKKLKNLKQETESNVSDHKQRKNLKEAKSLHEKRKKLEKNLAQPKEAKLVKKVAEPRIPTSVASSFKGGMHSFKKDCTLHSEANSSSPSAGSVSQGKKLWIDPHNGDWHKAYKKSGTVYIHKSCL